MDPHELQSLLEKYIKGTATAQERQFLDGYYSHFENRVDGLVGLNTNAMEQHKQMVLENIHKEIEGDNSSVRHIHFLKESLVKYAAAALLCIGIGAYLWNNNLKVKTENSKIVQANPVEKDVAPGSNKAILALADGTKIILDSVSEGLIAFQGNSRIIKSSDGMLAYQQAKNNSSGVAPSPLAGAKGVEPILCARRGAVNTN